MGGIYSTTNIPQGIPIYANATLFPAVAQDGEQAVAADTNTLYIYDSSVPGWQPVANPGAAIAIDGLTGEVTATGPGVVAATIAAAAVTNSKLAAMADNTVKGNKSGAPASPSDLTLSSVTEAVSSVLTISNGSNAVVSAADLTIQVLQSSAMQGGYLSSVDWTTFNNAATDVSNATALATPSTIMKRDASAYTALKGLELDGATSGNIQLQAADATTSYAVKMPNAQGAASTYLQNDGSGNLSWGTPANTALSNLTNPTAINQTLLFNPDATYDIGADGASRPFAIHASNHVTTATFRARDNDGLPQRQLTVRAGNSTTGNGDGGTLTLSGGTPNGTGIPGDILLTTNGVTRIDITGTGSINIPALSVSSFVGTDGSRNLTSLTASTATSYLNNFVGDSGAGGTKGLVPAPAAGDAAAGKYLKADGSWATVSGLPSQTSNQYKVLATDGSSASWQYAGLGDGSFGTNNIFLGRSKPSGLAGYSIENIIVGTDSQLNGANFSGASNILIGSAGSGQTFQNYKIAIGTAPNSTGNAYSCVLIGSRQYSATSNDSIVIGDLARSANTSVIIGSGAGTQADQSIAIGKSAVLGTGINSIVIGYNSGNFFTLTGANNTVLGSGSFNNASLSTAASNVIVGQGSGTAITTGTDNIIIGKSAATSLSTGASNVVIGNSSGTNVATNSVLIGYLADGYTESISIGKSSSTGNYGLAIGISSFAGNYGVGIGHTASGSGDGIAIGKNASANSSCLAIGISASGTTGMAIGNSSSCSGTDSTAVGVGSTASGQYTTAIGAYATTSAIRSVAIGYGAGYSSTNTASYSTFVGMWAGKSGVSGAGNTLIGAESGKAITSGASNTILGSQAAPSLSSGSGNIFLGYLSGKYSTTQSNELFIDNQDRTNYATQQSNSLIYGTFNATPSSQTLTVNADLTVTYNLKVPNYIISPQLYDIGTKTVGFTFDLGANGPCQQVTINAAGPLIITLSNPVTGGAYLLKLVQGATPGTVTWPATVKWGTAGAPTLSNTTGLIDIINLYWDGTNYFGTYALGY